MRVVLELQSGPYAGRKAWLQSGQTLQVGSTEDAEFVVADDQEMSAVHFSVTADRGGCRLTDLGSERGTFVNGQQVQEAELADGDQIEAGSTLQRVRIDGVRPGESVAAPGLRNSGGSPDLRPRPMAPPAVAPPPATRAGVGESGAAARAPQPRAAKGPYRYRREECGSGLVLLSSTEKADDPADVMQRVAKAAPLYLVVDREKLGLRLPADVQLPAYLLEWLPEATRDAASPMVLRPDETLQWRKVVADAWGQDALVSYFSRLDAERMLERLRRAARFNPTTGIELEDQTALSIWSPDVLRLVLIHSPAAHVAHLLEEIDAVLIESPDDGWQLFAGNDFAGSLAQHGFEPAEESPPKSKES